MADRPKIKRFTSTGRVTPEYFAWLEGKVPAREAFAQEAVEISPDTNLADKEPVLALGGGSNLAPLIDPEDPGGGGGGGGGDSGGGDGSGNSGTTLAYFLRRRYTSNLLVSEETKVIDLLYECILLGSRMYLAQGENGKIKLKHKKPVDWGLAVGALSGGDDTIAADDISAWAAAADNLLLIDPNSSVSEIRAVTDANYDTAQNSVTLTATANLTVSGFAGCDGGLTPATATLTVTGVASGSESNFVLNGITISWIGRFSDSLTTTAAFIAASINGHPILSRKFKATADLAIVTIKGTFGDLVLDTALANAHAAPQSNPSVAPTLTATASGTLNAGYYRVAYAFRNANGETLLSPFTQVILSGGQKITVTGISPPSGCTVAWYIGPKESSSALRLHTINDGAGFVIDSLPLLSSGRSADINRTGCELMRVSMAFTDRAEPRTAQPRSNVLRATFEWFLGSREKSVNRIDFKWRDSSQDFRLLELRLRNDEHIAKTKKISNKEINGQAVDNYNQAYRIANGLLAEYRDADFFYKWSTTREALLLEEGDVVAITDAGSGVVNLPVRIEVIEIDVGNSGLPKVNFTARKYSTTLYDDSVSERTIPVITASSPPPDPSAPLPPTLSGVAFSGGNVTGTIANNGGTGTIRIMRKAAGGSYSEVASVASSITAFTDSTLSVSGVYTYKLIQDGVTGASAEIEVTVDLSTVASLGTPSYNSTTNVISGTITNHGGSGNIHIWVKPGGTWIDLYQVANTVTTYEVTPEADGTYYFKATQDGISGESATVNITVSLTQAPPDGLTASFDGIDTVDLSWTNHGATGDVVVERKTNYGSFVAIATLGSATTTYNNTLAITPDPGEIYYYRVRNTSVLGYSNTESVFF